MAGETKKSEKKRQIYKVVEILVKKYPKIFNKKELKPLKLGILEDIGDHPRFCVKGRDKKFIYMTNPIESFNRNMRKYWSFFIDYEIFLIQIEKKIGFIQT